MSPLRALSLLTLVASALTTSASCLADPADDAAVARGQRLFLRCASCHELTDTGVAKNGPTLKGVIGRRVASVAGYEYSKSLAALSFDWDEARLAAWLERPTAVAPGTTMAFEGLPREADRKALIAYLNKAAR